MNARVKAKDTEVKHMERFFVATDGRDGWSGKLAVPNVKKTDGPFATLVGARNAIRGLKAAKDGLKEGLTVMVRAGKYFLEETLALGPEDSGTWECPITYTAYPGEKPILSGGRKVEGWKPYKGKILQCELPGAGGGRWKFRQLFFNGRRQVRARYPKFDPGNPLYGGWAFVEGPAEEGSYTSFKYKPGTFKLNLAKPRQAEVYMLSEWGITCIIPIKSIDEEDSIITMVDGVKDFNVIPWCVPTSFNTRSYRFYLENVLESLDRPGEWCLDTEDGMLYFWPPTGPIEEAEVIVPALDCLIDLRGASYINISGFNLTETTSSGDNMHRQGHEGYGAMFPVVGRKYCGEAVHMRGAEHCCIEKNIFYAVGGNAVYLEDYNARNIIQHNEIGYAGAIGICLIGSKYFHPIPHHPVYNQVVDNRIHHCGVFNKYVAGVFLGLSDGNLIGHNLIEHMPHHAINLGNSGYGRNIVEYNEIRHACLETFDNGAINSWMEDPQGHIYRDAERSGHIIRYNFIADTRGCQVDEECNLLPASIATVGIYLDNFTSNCFVYGNIIVRGGREGIRVNMGKNNIIENNTIIDSEVAIVCGSFHGYAPHMDGFTTGNRFSRNILYSFRHEGCLYCLYEDVKYTDTRKYPESEEKFGSCECLYPHERMIGQSDYNLFFKAIGEEYTIKEHSDPAGSKIFPLTEWQKMGFDTHSVIADPMFVDYEHDDYRLRPESPAFELGFKPIDVEKIGMRANK